VVARRYRLLCLVGIATVAATSACSHSSSSSAGAGAAAGGVLGVSCSNLSIHGDPPYTDEVSVKVKVRNSTARSATYAVDVTMTATHPKANNPAATTVTVTGSVPAGQTVQLERKVLTSSSVKNCTATKVTLTS
jgi:hypothetical protein